MKEHSNIVVIFMIFFLLLSAIPSRADACPKVRVLVSTYYAHRWSDTGRYRKVSKNKKRLGNFVALNFLPGGSIVTIPALFKTTRFEVADTFGGSGVGYFRGKRYWKVDILRNKDERHMDIDKPVDLYIIKFNKSGPVKNQQVRINSQNYMNLGK
jgi:hypothetical protein